MAWRLDVPLENQFGGNAPCKIDFYSSGGLLTLNGTTGQDPRKRLDGQVLSIQCGNDLNSPCGTFTLVLHNQRIQQDGPFRGRWLQDVIQAMDMVVVSFMRGPRMRNAMVGVVSARPTEHDQPGSPISTVTVSGFNLGKLLLLAGIYYFKDIPEQSVREYALKGYDFLGDTGGFPIGAKAAIAQVALKNFLYQFMSVNFNRPGQTPEGADVVNRDAVAQVLGYKLGKTYGAIPVSLGFFDQERSVYAFLSDLAEKPWCEVFTESLIDEPGFMDAMVPEVELEGAGNPRAPGQGQPLDTTAGVRAFDDCKPTIILRETPFDRAAWEALPLYTITDRVVQGSTVGGEPTIYNIFTVQPTAMGAGGTGAYKGMIGSGIFDLDSAHRHGYSPLVTQTRVFPFAGATIDTDIKQVATDLTNKLFTWFAMSGEFMSGSITVQGNACYKVGTRLRRVYLRGRDRIIDYYIEGVDHDWQAFGSYVTNLRITRGLSVDANRFPTPPGGDRQVTDSFNTDAPYPFRH